MVCWIAEWVTVFHACSIWLSVQSFTCICVVNWLNEWLYFMFVLWNDCEMSDTVDFFVVCLQVDGTGNCLFSAIKKLLSVHTATSQEATYFPNHYFRRMVVNCIVNHQQLIYNNKSLALMSLYGIKEQADPGRSWYPPLSFKQYLCLLLWRDFWGDEVVLHAISMKMTVLNTKILYQAWQDDG